MANFRTLLLVALLFACCSAMILERVPVPAEDASEEMEINSSVVLGDVQLPDETTSTDTPTEIPDCPSFTSCPWVYPQPTTEQPAENKTVISATHKPWISSFAPATPSLECPPYVSCPTTESANSTDNTHNATTTTTTTRRPAIPATQKPGYPSFVPGPWIYPVPIEPEVTSQESPTTQADLTEHFVAPNNESQTVGGTAVNSISATNKPECPPYVSCPTTESANSTDNKQQVGSNATTTTTTTRSPAISATQKPGYPSFVPGPWIYPLPIEPEVTSQETSTTQAELAEHFGGPDNKKNESQPVDNNGGGTAVNSISATLKPECPSYVSCPWIYPQPTTESPEPAANSTDNNSTSTISPAISATQKPGYPSFVPGPWIYPVPIEPEVTSQETSTIQAELTEHIDSKKNESQSVDKISGGSTANSISATQKPGYPSYVPGPWIYPKPIGEGTTTTTTTTEKEEATGDRIGGTTEIPDCPSFVSCPWIYPRPTTAAPSDEDGLHFPGPTARPVRPAVLLTSLWNPFEDDLSDVIEAYAANFFFYAPKYKHRRRPAGPLMVAVPL